MGNFFGGGSAGSTPTRYAGIQVSTSIMGQVIPLVMGRNRVPMNLMWYGGFTATPVKSGGKGGGAPSSYSYSASFQAGLCLGPIVGIISVWSDKTQTTLTYENLTAALGAIGQPTWSGYPAGTPANQQIPYSSTAWVGSQDFILGSSPAMPNFTYEIEGAVAGFSDAHGMYDVDPPSIITAYLTNPVWGAGFTGAIAPMTGATNTYQAWCGALGIFLSPIEDNQRSATDFIAEVMQITNSDLVLSCGTLKVIPYADAAVAGTTPDGTAWSYTPNLTPVFQFTDDDYCPKEGEDPVMLDRKASTDLYNMVSVEYVDRANLYNPQPAPAQDNYDISVRGPRPMSQLSFHQICQASVARTVAQLILQFQLYERNTYTFRVRWPFSLVEPMDYIGVTEANLGLVNQVCRVIETQDSVDNEFTIKCMKVTGTIRTSALFNFAGSQGYYANFGAAAPSVDTPAIFLMPPIAASLSEGFTLGIAVSNPSSSTNWGGCKVNLSLDGGTTYSEVGLIGENGPGNYGTLTSNLPLHADPDTVSSFGIQLDNTANQISTAVTHANADAMLTLALIGSGSNTEVIAYGSATLTGPGAYTLSYLRRGLYGTTPLANTSGARFVNLDGAVFQVALDPGQAGQTINLKFQSFNSVGAQTQDLSACTAYSYTLPEAVAVSGVATLIARGACVVSGQTGYKSTTATTAWDSDIITPAAYPSLSISAQLSAATASTFVVALTSSVAAIVGSGSPDFFFYSAAGIGTNLKIYEGATLVWTSGTNLAKNDLLEITYDGFSVRFYWNSVLVFTAQKQGALFYAGIGMKMPGEVFSNILVSTGLLSTPSQWVATGNCVVNDTNAMKQGGSGAWDSTVYSVIGYPTCHITAKVNEVGGSSTNHCMIGLSTTPAGGVSYFLANFALLNTGTSYQIYEAGSLIGTFGGAPTLSDVLAITYDGSTVSYWINGVVVHFTAAAGLTLYGFCPFFAPGAGLNSLRFGPTTSLALPLVGGAALLTARGGAVLNGQMLTKPTGTTAWDSDAVSGQAYAAGAIQAEYKIGSGTTPYMALGFCTTLPGSPIAPSTPGFYGIYTDSVSGTGVYENGVFIPTGPAASNNDLYLVTYDGFSIRYYINGVPVWTTAAALGPLYFMMTMYTPGANFGYADIQITTSSQSTPSQFIAVGNCTVNDTNAMKDGGAANTWDSCIYSAIGYSTCHITAKANQVGAFGPGNQYEVAIGLATKPTSGVDYTVPNYSFQTGDNSGNILVFESGTQIFGLTLPPQALSNVYAITYDGAVVTYLVDGIAVRTVSVSSLTLYGFCSFEQPTAGLNSLRFGPTTNLAVIDTVQAGLNMATALVVATASNVACGSSNFGVWTNITSVTVGPFPYATEVVLTFTGEWSEPATSSGAAVNVGFSLSSSGSTGGFGATQIAPTAASQVGNIAIETTVPLAANTSTTYYLNGISQPSTGPNHFNIDSATVKAEVIKR